MSKVEFVVSSKPIEYVHSFSFMEEKVRNIHHGDRDMVWFLEHHDIYTGGTSANAEKELLNKSIPVLKTNRGGRITWHGKGQLVCYVMLNLNKRERDIRKFVSNIEKWVMETLLSYEIVCFSCSKRVGLWVQDKDDPIKEDKIAAIGVRLTKWVSWHGFSINVNPDLSKFNAIIPCGIEDDRYGVTSMQKLGVAAKFDDVADSLQKKFYTIF